MNPMTWTEDDWRSFWISLWANLALAIAVFIIVRSGR